VSSCCECGDEPSGSCATELVRLVILKQCFPKYGTPTTGGTLKNFKGYAAENKLLNVIKETN
jgi:hypothetical protein